MDFVVTRAPFRISFAGGGTDLPSFYEKGSGTVVSTTINKYVYVMVNKCRPLLTHGIDDVSRYHIRLSYSSTENVQSIDQLKHPIVREALKLVELDIPLDIATMADVPAGNGLGSSGTFSVALLHALHLIKGEDVGPAQLASEAAQIEIYRLDRPVGKQDHYAAAYGGLNVINFHADGGVDVNPMDNPESLAQELFPNLLLLHTGVSRDAGEVLKEQMENSEIITDDLLNIRGHAYKLQRLFENGFQAGSLGEVMHESWMRKRQLSSMISTGQIDRWYEAALDAGALGGKVCGAGGGGFLLLVVEPSQRQRVREALKDLSELIIGYEPAGSTAMLPH